MKENLVRSGNKVNFVGELGNMGYSFESGVVYEAKFDSYEDRVYLEIKNSFCLPTQLYKTKKDDNFLYKVIKSFNNAEEKTIGVLLTGYKGSGKTVMSKLIAKEANLPIIIINSNFGLANISKLIKCVNKSNVCFLIDELDKFSQYQRNDQSYLLNVLDGLDTTTKHMFIITANDSSVLTDYIKDRCSRIRYSKQYEKIENDMIKEIVNNRLKNKDRIEEVIDFIVKNIKASSIDNIISFVDEINNFPQFNINELFDDMNLS